MRRLKVGVYQFSNPLASERDGRKRNDFNSLPFTGLRRILRALDGADIGTARQSNLDDFDAVLISMISFWDYLNIIREIPNHATKIIVGGPALMNIQSILTKIDGAFWGRCDGKLINELLAGGQHASFWQKQIDPYFEGRYTVCPADPRSLHSPQLTLSGIPEFREGAVGCGKRCHFCAYAWWNKYTPGMVGGYRSGTATNEDFLAHLDWNKCKRGGVSGLDGNSERTRERIGKRITSTEIKETLLRSNGVSFDKKLRLKLYGIYGFPWEDPERFVGEMDLPQAAAEVDCNLLNKIVIRMHFSHFIPYPKTPLWASPFNWGDFRSAVMRSPTLFYGNNIFVYSGAHTNQGINASAITTGIQRCQAANAERYGAVVASNKFLRLRQTEKKTVLQSQFPELFAEQQLDPVLNIETPYKWRL